MFGAAKELPVPTDKTHRLEIGDVLYAHGGWGSYEELTIVAVSEETATAERRWREDVKYPNGGKPFTRNEERVKRLVFWRTHIPGSDEINGPSFKGLDGPPSSWHLKKLAQNPT